MDISSSEKMILRAADALQDRDVVFVGIGLPSLACNLARHLHAPNLTMIYESGTVGTQPERLPLSIGDPSLVNQSLSIVSQADVFQNYLQGGRVDVGFLGGAQIDIHGNINSTVIGNYAHPKIRLPGSGGACEIATLAKKIYVLMSLSPRAFVEKVDFVTSPGVRESGESGIDLVITDKCVFRPEKGRLVVTEVFEGDSQESIQKVCGFPVHLSENCRTIQFSKIEDLTVLREKFTQA